MGAHISLQCTTIMTTSEWVAAHHNNQTQRWQNKCDWKSTHWKEDGKWESWGGHTNTVGPNFYSSLLVAFQVNVRMMVLSLSHNCNPIKKLQARFEILQVPVPLQLEPCISPCYSPPNHLLEKNVHYFQISHSHGKYKIQGRCKICTRDLSSSNFHKSPCKALFVHGTRIAADF